MADTESGAVPGSAIEEILEFWFGPGAGELGDGAIAERQADLWWGKGEADRIVARRFGRLLRQAPDQGAAGWPTDARSRLALIILLDQFSRNVHRDTPEAFAQDRLALAHSLDGQSRHQDLALRPVERVFFYMPMEHAESLPVQDQCVRRFSELLDAVPEEERKPFRTFLDFAERHRDIVLRFGRFPHRNAVLGRESTPEELAFLEQPDSSF